MHFAAYKTILSAKNNMNIYRGCTHGCIYCDSRSACYQMAHPFEDIEIKKDAPQILEAQLKKRRTPCMITTGAMTDPYIHLETQLQYTRQCLEVIEKHRFGLAILTKSNRIIRDLDLLEKINNQTKCVVEMTLTTYDENLCRVVEPNVSTTFERFQTLMKMKERGIPTVVWLGPFLPFINDDEDNLKGLLDYCIRAQVKGIICFGFGLTLREGNREYFYEKLDQHFPVLKQKYIRKYGNAYNCQSPNTPHLQKLFKHTCIQNGIMYRYEEIFEYLDTFEARQSQLSLF